MADVWNLGSNLPALEKIGIWMVLNNLGET